LGYKIVTVTSVQIIEMFETAHEVEKKLPAAIKNGMSSMRFEVVNEKTEHAAWKKAKPRLTATANEIAIFEFVLFYLNPMLDVKERKLVWARSIKIPWHYIGSHILKCSRHTAKKRYMEIIRLLRMRILISDELIKKLPRL
tara:strand:- start:6211 stop:6633 length:423 start_codon:yes stop_codon:yes gene_type:complete